MKKILASASKVSDDRTATPGLPWVLTEYLLCELNSARGVAFPRPSFMPSDTSESGGDFRGGGNEQARRFVVLEPPILGSARSVFSFSKLPFMHKTEEARMCVAKGVRRAELDARRFQLPAL